MKSKMYIMYFLLLVSAILHALIVVHGSESPLGNTKLQKGAHPSTDDGRCHDGYPFIWCIPQYYNRVHEPWWDITTTDSTFPWIYKFHFEIIEIPVSYTHLTLPTKRIV